MKLILILSLISGSKVNYGVNNATWGVGGVACDACECYIVASSGVGNALALRCDATAGAGDASTSLRQRLDRRRGPQRPPNGRPQRGRYRRCQCRHGAFKSSEWDTAAGADAASGAVVFRCLGRRSRRTPRWWHRQPVPVKQGRRMAQHWTEWSTGRWATLPHWYFNSNELIVRVTTADISNGQWSAEFNKSSFEIRQVFCMRARCSTTVRPSSARTTSQNRVAVKSIPHCQSIFAIEFHRWWWIIETFRWVGGTQMEPTDARRVFPCFDEPNYKATFQVTVGHWAALTALSNMPLLSSSTM